MSLAVASPWARCGGCSPTSICFFDTEAVEAENPACQETTETIATVAPNVDGLLDVELEEVDGAPPQISRAPSGSTYQNPDNVSTMPQAPTGSGTTSPNRQGRPPPAEGMVRLAGFDIRETSLPEGYRQVNDLIERMASLRREVAEHIELTHLDSLRYLLGCNFDKEEAIKRAKDVAAWRNNNSMQAVRDYLRNGLQETGRVQIRYHEEVCKFCIARPCSLVTRNGSPVSIWHVGTVNASKASVVEDEKLSSWSRDTFEYVDLWISRGSETSGSLQGHIHVFDLAGISLSKMTTLIALLDKFKCLFGAGGYYMEAVSHIYVINSSSVFSIAWRIVKKFLEPRTIGKIIVDNGVPELLFNTLSPDSAQNLRDLLKNPAVSTTVQSPAWAGETGETREVADDGESN